MRARSTTESAAPWVMCSAKLVANMADPNMAATTRKARARSRAVSESRSDTSSLDKLGPLTLRWVPRCARFRRVAVARLSCPSPAPSNRNQRFSSRFSRSPNGPEIRTHRGVRSVRPRAQPHHACPICAVCERHFRRVHHGGCRRGDRRPGASCAGPRRSGDGRELRCACWYHRDEHGAVNDSRRSWGEPGDGGDGVSSRDRR